MCVLVFVFENIRNAKNSFPHIVIALDCQRHSKQFLYFQHKRINIQLTEADQTFPDLCAALKAVMLLI